MEEAGEIPVPLWQWVKRIASGRYFWLFAALTVFILVAGEAPATANVRWESALALMGLMVTSVVAARTRRRTLAAAVVLNLLLVATWTLWRCFPGAVTGFLCFGVLFLCLLVALFSTLGYVLSTGKVTPNHILGALCGYMMIAMIFTTVFTIQWMGDPAVFRGLDPNTDRLWPELFYFSATTLTTGTYGDILPATLRTRSVCIIEQLAGVFYMAVFIARVTGLYAQAAQSRSVNEKSPNSNEMSAGK